jgi:hypothetical protein
MYSRETSMGPARKKNRIARYLHNIECFTNYRVVSIGILEKVYTQQLF